MSQVNEWGVEWDEKFDGWPDVSGPYLTAKGARDALESSAFEGRIVWRSVVVSDWRDWEGSGR